MMGASSTALRFERCLKILSSDNPCITSRARAQEEWVGVGGGAMASKAGEPVLEEVCEATAF
eukprot:scaffold61417_cov31-Tisochrysis_lutea.AAC.2